MDRMDTRPEGRIYTRPEGRIYTCPGGRMLALVSGVFVHAMDRPRLVHALHASQCLTG
jgi:hypothetical protein